MNKRLSVSKRVTLGGMVTAVAVLCLYAASVLPAGVLVCYFFAAMTSVVLTIENAYGIALVSYAATSALAFFILPDKTPAYIYTLLLGHYAIFRSALHAHVHGKVLRVLAKVLYCDFFLGVGVFLAFRLLAEFPFTMPEWLPIWAALILLEAGIVVFDILFGAGVILYETHIRRLLVPRR